MTPSSSHAPDPHPHPHRHPHGPTPPPPEPALDDAGSTALADALRSSFVVVRILLVLLAGYFIFSGVFVVNSQERALLLRFGEPVRRGGELVLGPGLHWAFPYPIDESIKLPVAQLQTVRSSVAWYAVSPEQEAADIVPDPGPSLNPAIDGYAVTGDGNILHARALVRYRITDPLKFYLTHEDGTVLMTNLVDNAVNFAAAQFRVDDALRRNVAGFKELVLKRLQELVIIHDAGVTLEPSDVVTIPPRQVKADFDQVLSAEVERAKTISDAQGYANRVVNEARGRATARLNAGETDRNRMVQAVSSEAQQFSSLLPEYQANPDFFRRSLQIAALSRILTNAEDKFFLPLNQRDQLRLFLNREPATPTPPVNRP